jgi:phenylpyruvate tautomerase PptA (4-oxalocrotonate tautomerase family)
MPYIHTSISKKITKEQKVAVKEALGALISRIPDKSESVLMLRIDDGAPMYYQGKEQDCVFVGIHLYTAAPMQTKADFSSALAESIASITGIAPSNIFMTFTEYENWVSNGKLK